MKGYWVTWEKYWRAPLKSPRACNSLPFSNNSTPRETLCEIKALASLSERVTGSYSCEMTLSPSQNAGKGRKMKLERGIEKRNKRLFESWALKALVLFWWQEFLILMVLGFRNGRWEMGGAATALHAPTIPSHFWYFAFYLLIKIFNAFFFLFSEYFNITFFILKLYQNIFFRRIYLFVYK